MTDHTQPVYQIPTSGLEERIWQEKISALEFGFRYLSGVGQQIMEDANQGNWDLAR